jgi:hypothetical protein
MDVVKIRRWKSSFTSVEQQHTTLMHSHMSFCADIFMRILPLPCYVLRSDKKSLHKNINSLQDPSVTFEMVLRHIMPSNLQHIINLLKSDKFCSTQHTCNVLAHNIDSLKLWQKNTGRFFFQIFFSHSLDVDNKLKFLSRST